MKMSESREEILADFQACTGIEDLADAIFHLEEANWDLMKAVSRVMPPDSQAFQTDQSDSDVMIVDDTNIPAIPVESAVDVMVGNNLGHSGAKMVLNKKVHKNNKADDNKPSTSSAKNFLKKIKFNIQYQDRIIPLELNDTSTIGDLKISLQRELNISPCRQILSGWAKLSQNENISFSKLMLNKENSLHLTVKPLEGGVSTENEAEMSEKLNGTYTLNIKHGDKIFSLKYKGTTSILEIKSGLYSLTNVQVRNQVWTGWPPNLDDQTMIALTEINFPEHDLEFSSIVSTSNNSEGKQNPHVVKIDSDDDEFEDASESFNVDDDYFVEQVVNKPSEPLIPDNVEDEIVGSLTFSERFTSRYGPIHPSFFQGSLEEAIQEACNKPAKDRKILAIYLHHDSSVLTNVFCTQLLGFESVMQMFENNFTLWGWDLTFESNFAKLQASVTKNLGPVAALSLRNMPVDRLPAIVLIMRIRSSTDIFDVIHGNVGVNEFLSSLIEAVEVFSDHQRVEVKEEQERAERELVKWEQDQAYHESLEADRAKEEAKRSKAQAESEARKRQENEQAEEMRKKEEYRMRVEKSLPAEPPLGHGDKDVTKIRFRLPKGESLERRFLISTPLKVLIDYLTVKGYPNEEYKVISSWPRRDLTALDQNKTLDELKLCPQETVILEER